MTPPSPPPTWMSGTILTWPEPTSRSAATSAVCSEPMALRWASKPLARARPSASSADAVASPMASVRVASAAPVIVMTAASPSARARAASARDVSMSIDTFACASCDCMSATPRCCSRLTRATWASRCWANVARSWAAISRLVSTLTRSSGNTTSWM